MNLSLALPTSAGALVAIVVIFVLRGDLLTRRMVDRICAIYDKRLAEKDEQIMLWRTAHDMVKKNNDTLITQLYQSLEIGRVTNRVLEAVPASQPTPHGDPNGPTVAA